MIESRRRRQRAKGSRRPSHCGELGEANGFAGWSEDIDSDSQFPAESDSFLDGALHSLDTLMKECKRLLSNRSAPNSDAVDFAHQAYEQIAGICVHAGITNMGVCDSDPADFPARNNHERRGSERSCCCEENISLDVEYSDEDVDNESLRDECKSDHSFSTSRSQEYEGSVSGLSSVSTRRLQNELASTEVSHPNDALAAIQLQLSQTNERINKLETATHDTRRSVERSMQDQAQYWRTICDELVRDKRGLATQLAEERGRLAALKLRSDIRGSSTPEQKRSPPTLVLSDISSELAPITPSDSHIESPSRDNNNLSPSPTSSPDDGAAAATTTSLGLCKTQTPAEDRLPSFRRNYLSLGQSRLHSSSR